MSMASSTEEEEFWLEHGCTWFLLRSRHLRGFFVCAGWWGAGHFSGFQSFIHVAAYYHVQDVSRVFSHLQYSCCYVLSCTGGVEGVKSFLVLCGVDFISSRIFLVISSFNKAVKQCKTFSYHIGIGAFSDRCICTLYTYLMCVR